MDGWWSGLLFDNPAVRLPAGLTWSFHIPLGDGAVEIDWLELPVTGWQAMAGSAGAGGNAEAVVYAGGHHRYDHVALDVAEQDGQRIRVRAAVSGDVDAYGPKEITADGWLGFAGIAVQLSDVHSAPDALARLAAFTDVRALVEAPDPRGIAYRFAVPA